MFCKQLDCSGVTFERRHLSVDKKKQILMKQRFDCDVKDLACRHILDELNRSESRTADDEHDD